MTFPHKFSTALAISGLFLAFAVNSRAASQQYNFSFELTNSTGVDLYTDGSFFADPTMATTSHGPDAAGDLFSTSVGSLAFTVFDFGGSVLGGGTENYGNGDLQTTGLVYYSSFNPPDGLASPVFTLSAPDATGYLTLVLNGQSASFYQSNSLGSTTGTPIISGPAGPAQSLDASPTPEPASLPLAATAGAFLLFCFRRRFLRA